LEIFSAQQPSVIAPSGREPGCEAFGQNVEIIVCGLD
jgi:hypothetical protein